MNPSRLLSVIVGSLVAGGAMGSYGSPHAGAQLLDSAIETFVRQALEDRLAVDDIPDIKLLGSAKRIGIREELPLAGLKLSSGAMPRREGYEFYPVSRSEAQSMADQTQQHVYLVTVDRPSISGNSATLWLGVDLVVPKKPKTVVTCCCRMLARFELRERQWRFEKRLDFICR